VVYIRDYHTWVASLLDSLNEGRPYAIDEYSFIHANSWIIDSLRATDYYLLKDRGIINEDPKAIQLVSEGTTLIVPDANEVNRIQKMMANTYIDINVPEFKLRIFQGDSVVAAFPVRVGKNDSRYLEMAGKKVNLRTNTGEGKIVRINRAPIFINPKDNKRYKVTHRDDGVVTGLPNIPWLEQEINGIRYGQLIHPTTNLETLGKPVSNGCIGLREADAWTVYFYAPIGTPVHIRYDLVIPGPEGDTLKLKNIYPGFEQKPTRPDSHKKQSDTGIPASKTLCYCGPENE
jgi:L,D-transpeptidase ErfK/SrfK